jgi:hypothetical protein
MNHSCIVAPNKKTAKPFWGHLPDALEKCCKDRAKFMEVLADAKKDQKDRIIKINGNEVTFPLLDFTSQNASSSTTMAAESSKDESASDYGEKTSKRPRSKKTSQRKKTTKKKPPQEKTNEEEVASDDDNNEEEEEEEEPVQQYDDAANVEEEEEEEEEEEGLALEQEAVNLLGQQQQQQPQQQQPHLDPLDIYDDPTVQGFDFNRTPRTPYVHHPNQSPYPINDLGDMDYFMDPAESAGTPVYAPISLFPSPQPSPKKRQRSQSDPIEPPATKKQRTDVPANEKEAPPDAQMIAASTVNNDNMQVDDNNVPAVPHLPPAPLPQHEELKTGGFTFNNLLRYIGTVTSSDSALQSTLQGMIEAHLAFVIPAPRELFEQLKSMCYPAEEEQWGLHPTHNAGVPKATMGLLHTLYFRFLACFQLSSRYLEGMLTSVRHTASLFDQHREYSTDIAKAKFMDEIAKMEKFNFKTAESLIRDYVSKQEALPPLAPTLIDAARHVQLYLVSVVAMLGSFALFAQCARMIFKNFPDDAERIHQHLQSLFAIIRDDAAVTYDVYLDARDCTVCHQPFPMYSTEGDKCISCRLESLFPDDFADTVTESLYAKVHEYVDSVNAIAGILALRNC